jgi:hypothetical protein
MHAGRLGIAQVDGEYSGHPARAQTHSERTNDGNDDDYCSDRRLHVMKKSFNSSHQQRISKMKINFLTYSVVP